MTAPCCAEGSSNQARANTVLARKGETLTP
jgi:hypothetical protein